MDSEGGQSSSASRISQRVQPHRSSAAVSGSVQGPSPLAAYLRERLCAPWVVSLLLGGLVSFTFGTPAALPLPLYSGLWALT